ncbi:MAG: hypothetical protein D4R70_02020 [Betaproteobacteria bacterium]|nr:MAG: hypothetical protein D4R70_02020 [Betaproteobacteria bacterium]
MGLFLMALMMATRFHHFGDALHLPDASWAIFFVAGFYLSPLWLLALLAEAVAVDAVAIGWLGVSDYCVTQAYAILQLAHGALWLGGRGLRRYAMPDWRGAAALVGFGVAAWFVAFAVSNGSFYWLGGRLPEPNWTEFMQTWADYSLKFLGTMSVYLSAAAVVQWLAHRWVSGASTTHAA